MHKLVEHRSVFLSLSLSLLHSVKSINLKTRIHVSETAGALIICETQVVATSKFRGKSETDFLIHHPLISLSLVLSLSKSHPVPSLLWLLDYLLTATFTQSFLVYRLGHSLHPSSLSFS